MLKDKNYYKLTDKVVINLNLVKAIKLEPYLRREFSDTKCVRFYYNRYNENYLDYDEVCDNNINDYDRAMQFFKLDKN